MVDRLNPQAAAAVVLKLIPHAEDRKAVLAHLADSIFAAHGIGAARWGLTLGDKFIRLNTGQQQAFVIEESFVTVSVDRKTLEKIAPELPKGIDLEDWSNWPEWQLVGFESVLAREVLPLLQPAILEFVQQAASKRRRTTFYKAHSPGLLDYLRQELPDREVPEPDYHASDFKASASADDEASSLEARGRLPDPAMVADPAWAQQLMESWIPEVSDRQAILGLLADDIQAAYVAAPKHWFLAVTMSGRQTVKWVNLLVNNITIVSLRPKPCVGVDFGGAVPEGIRLAERVFGSLSPTACHTESLPPSELAALLPELLAAHRVYREAIVAHPHRTSYADYHSSGMMQYLREFLDRELPDPEPPATGLWLLQQNAEMHGTLADLWKDLPASAEGVWWVKTRPEDLQEGDLVAFYQASEAPGIYGLGKLVSPSFVDDDGDQKVRYRLTRRLTEPIALGALRAAGAPVGGRGIWNKAVAPEQWEALMELMDPPDGFSLSPAFTTAGLHYTPEQLATFLTALSTKGFVILSGISGTGKSKIAQRLAELLPAWPSTSAATPAMLETLRVSPYMRQRGFFVVPKRIHTGLVTPAPGSSIEVEVHTPAGTETGRLYTYPEGDKVLLTLRGSGKQWLAQSTTEGENLILRPEINAEMEPTAFRLGRLGDFAPEPDASPGDAPPTHLFLPVRPDWRDSKPLLGYYNPLSGAYQSTKFLEFLQRAKANWDDSNVETVAFLVILDEMNLARVEYYFADLLSVLESGRDADGLIIEPLTFGSNDDDMLDEPLPPDLHLPPNLYFVGTVNVDETTHGFSPKVLDRAFTIELNEVDFTAYDPGVAGDATDDDAMRDATLQLLSGAGRWAYVRKDEVAAVLAVHPAIRERLSAVNDLLRPHQLHFGYRVFDEICAFVGWSERNGLWHDLGGWEAAFDAAVLMKVLPKFHGSKAKLQAPLEALQGWCGEGMPRTRQRVERMLEELRQVGFTAFS